MVWTESLKTYRDMVSVEKWEDKTEIILPIVQDLMFKVYFQLTMLVCVLTLLHNLISLLF